MIQRIQSVWLFLAAMVSGSLFMPSMVLYRYTVPGGFTGGKVESLSTLNFYPLLVVAVVMTLLPLVAIFMFKDRKRQRGMAVLSILACIGFISLMFMKIGNINNKMPAPANQVYGIVGSVVPVAAIIFLILAIKGIRKDEKLIKSLDRLR